MAVKATSDQPTVSWGYLDSITTNKTLQIPDLDYKADFAVKENTADKVVLVNRTTPVNQPEYIRFGYQNIANIYSGTGIDPSVMATTKRGLSVVGQVDDTISVSCPSDSCGRQIMLPISAHWVLKFPISQFVTADMALIALLRAFSTAFDTGSTTRQRLEAIIRGALMPTGL